MYCKDPYERKKLYEKYENGNKVVIGYCNKKKDLMKDVLHYVKVVKVGKNYLQVIFQNGEN